MTTKIQDGVRRRGLLNAAVMAGVMPPLMLAAAPTVAFAAPAPAPAPAPADTEGGQTVRLAAYGASLRYEDIPPAARQRAKDAITDVVGAIIYGAELPWSRMIIAYARRTGPGGRSPIIGAGPGDVQAPMAAFAHGAMAHAFELDNLTKPDSGSHPGAALFSSAVAVAQDQGLSGRALLTAFVAGAEVMMRIGYATEHSDEERGFHAPSASGPFGAAVVTGHLNGFDAARMTNALGIAGSCSSGLLAFAHSGDGAMVKRFNMGRGAEGGVLAASLAAEGFEGPSKVIECEAGFLRAFCPTWDMSQLTDGLGTTFKTMNIMIKRYACHITAHNSVEGTRELRAQNGFKADDIAAITIAGSPRMATINNIPAPPDALLAQFSIPFCVALTMYRDPIDPRSFDENVAKDPQILALAKLVTMQVTPGQSNRDMTCVVTIRLKDGRELSTRVTAFTGMPERPLDRAGLREKFMLLTRGHPEPDMSRLFDRLQQIDSEADLAWLRV
jgi:2-methylcitrate dehydratase PrpD